MKTLYRYGMRERPVDIGCQPNDFDHFDESDSRYWNVVYYDHKLSTEDADHYSMDYLGTDGSDDFPNDAENSNDSEAAEEVAWPEGMSQRAMMVLEYFEGTMYLFRYKGKYVITDESGALEESGDGSTGKPIEGPRAIFDSTEEIEPWLESIADEYDRIQEKGEEVPGWNETKEWYSE